MSSSEEETAALCVLDEEEEKEKKGRRLWVHVVCKNTMSHGQFSFLYPDLLEDTA